MENLSHQFSRKNYAANGGFPPTSGGKSMYDDVFGGAPKFSLNSLAPRLQDYNEIFGGFHSSRSSSIPVLDLPSVDVDEDAVDVRSSSFDYSEVFKRPNGVDFAVSFEDLVCEANGGYDSSDEAWSPAHSGSLSGETDPSACSEKSQSFPNADIHQSVNDIKQFDVLYHKAQQRSYEHISNGIANTSHLHAIPGYTCVVDETVGPQKADSEERPYQLPNHLNYSQDFEDRVVEEKRFSKSMSLTMNTGVRKHGSDRNPSGKSSISSPITNVSHLSVSDISLRTKPSQLPPPSRPPPVLAVRKGESGIAHSKLKASKSYAFERVASDKLSPFFDVKLDGYSSSAPMQDAVEETRSKLRSTEEVMEGKEDLQSRTELQVEDDMNVTKQNMIRILDKCNDFDKEGSRTETSAEERKRVTKTSQMVAEGIDRELDVNVFEKSAERKHRRARTSSQGSFKREETVAWREGADFFEVETDNSWMSFEQVKAKNVSKRDVESQEKRQCQNTGAEPFEPKESNIKINAAKMAPEWEDEDHPPKVAELSFQLIGSEGRSRTTKGSSSHPENQKNGLVNETTHSLEANEEKLYVAQQQGESGKLFDKDKNVKNLKGANQESCLPESKQESKATTKKNVTDGNSRKRNEMRSEEVFQREHCERQNEDEKKAKERQEQEQREEQQMESWEREGKREIQPEALERNENANEPREVLEQKNVKKLSQIQDGGSEKVGKMDLAQEDYLEEQKPALKRKEYTEMLIESREQEEIEKELEASLEQDTCKIDKAHQKDSNQEPLNHASSGRRSSKMRPKEAMGQEIYTNRSTVAFKDEEAEIQSKEAIWQETIEYMSDNAGKREELSRKIGKKEQIERNAGTKGEKFMAFCDTWELNNGSLNAEDQPVNLQFKEGFNLCDKNQDVLPGVQEHSTKENQVGTGSDKPSTRQVEVASHTNDFENMTVISPEVQIGVKVGGVQVTVDKGVMREKFTARQVVMEWVDNAKNIGDALQGVLEDIGGISDKDQSGTTEGTETKENNINGIPLPEETKIRKTLKEDREMEHEHFETTKEERERQREREKDLMAETQRAGERLKERELENELLKRIEEEREREREREKDRMAVDSAIREARERSYSEARERAERAAFERANAEVRQRAMAEARERLQKASAEAREARTRAERAAVERATTEARQRAFGKAMAEKAHVEARDKSDKLRSTDIRFQSSGTSTGLKYTHSSSHVGMDGESPQRCKARLERYQRTAERAAKALAEKNMRDLVAQREQDERNRLAEILDAEVRRWSSGKEGNLRALLSTLQYILGPDGGWQPIPLTEVITSAAVKRAYRKATLCVHPDKLQQRGASIQQKYICEKVFDLLKDAWNKFNSEER